MQDFAVKIGVVFFMRRYTVIKNFIKCFMKVQL